MTIDQTPLVTGSLRSGESDAVVIGRWLGDAATGDEYGGPFLFAKLLLAELWGVHVRQAQHGSDSSQPSADDSIGALAAAVARQVPAVSVQRPRLPELSGDVLEDARLVTGLTLDQIGRATGVSGRAVASWRAGTVPWHREAFLQALRSIGLSLIGGLGAKGVQQWFLSGSPSRLDRLAAGQVEGVAAEARAYETSPVT